MGDQHNARRVVLVAPFQASASGPTLRIHGQAVPVFLNLKRDVNGSAAALCVLMALLALGEVSRGECLRLATASPTQQFRRVWPWIVRDYVVGADTHELKELIKMLTSAPSSMTFAKNG